MCMNNTSLASPLMLIDEFRLLLLVLTNLCQFLCGTPVQDHRKRPKCRDTILPANPAPHSVLHGAAGHATARARHHRALDRSPAALAHPLPFGAWARLCAVVMHHRFAGTVTDYVKRWGGKRQLWLRGPDGVHLGGAGWDPSRGPVLDVRECIGWASGTQVKLRGLGLIRGRIRGRGSMPCPVTIRG
jgi:hypothetical protein